jgi:hypothetical protein
MNRVDELQKLLPNSLTKQGKGKPYLYKRDEIRLLNPDNFPLA